MNKTPQKYSKNEGGGGSGGGKNKSSSAKLFTNSNKSAELQSLLSATFPTNYQLVFDNKAALQQNKRRRGGGGGGAGNNSVSSQRRKSTGAASKVMEASINDEESNRLNATALRRIDTAFSKLHGTASQVAVYRHNPTTQSWDKTDTVGCLFLYERNEPPQYGLVVMNRKNTNNFIQCFGADTQVMLNTPYLLLRAAEDLISDPNDGTQAIHCIWFYEAQDCATSANILRNMGLKFEGETMDGDGTAMRVNAGLGNHLFQILQGKKESPQPRAGARVMTAEELESQMLHESENNTSAHQFTPPVLNGGNQGSSKNPDSPRNPGTPLTPSTTDSALFRQILNMTIKDSPSDNKCGAALPKNVSSSSVSQTSVAHSLGTRNQMRTVEQLERDMNRERSKGRSSASAVAIQNELMQTLGIPHATGIENTGLGQGKLSPGQDRSKSVDQALLENILGKTVDETDPEVLREVLQNVEPSNLILVTETVPGCDETRLTWRLNRSSSLRKENDSTFTTPTGEFVSASGTRCSSQLGLGTEARNFEASPRSSDVKPSPLTQDQLLQAFLYLLQNDSEFVGKIHEAYVKSLQQAYEGRQF